MKRLTLLVSIPLLLSASLALAQSKAPTKVPHKAQPAATADKDCAKARAQGRACSLVFESDNVDGQTPGANGIGVMVVNPANHTSLIRVRTSFKDRILRTAEGIL
jgi:hypothetical protein